MSEYTGKLREIRDRLADTRQTAAFLRSCADVISESLDRSIRVGGRPAFAPLAPLTLEIKASLGQPLRPGVATGAMLMATQVGDPNNVMRIEGNRLEFGFGPEIAWYVRKFDEGDPQNRQPARPFLMFQPEDRTELFRRWADFVTEGVIP